MRFHELSLASLLVTAAAQAGASGSARVSVIPSITYFPETATIGVAPMLSELSLALPSAVGTILAAPVPGLTAQLASLPASEIQAKFAIASTYPEPQDPSAIPVPTASRSSILDGVDRDGKTDKMSEDQRFDGTTSRSSAVDSWPVDSRSPSIIRRVMTTILNPKMLWRKIPGKRGRMDTKEDIIKKLGLLPLPGEGGYYRETYRSGATVDAKSVGIDAEGRRSVGTAIFYLVGPDEFSALHRLKTDELFHFYAGDPVEMLQISEDGTVKKVLLGPDVLSGHEPQVLVQAGVWQGTRLQGRGSWALLGTTMAPGFEFSDFELGARKALTARYPKLTADIERFTRSE